MYKRNKFQSFKCASSKKFFKNFPVEHPAFIDVAIAFEKLLNACEKMRLRNLCDGLKYRVQNRIMLKSSISILEIMKFFLYIKLSTRHAYVVYKFMRSVKR